MRNEYDQTPEEENEFLYKFNFYNLPISRGFIFQTKDGVSWWSKTAPIYDESVDAWAFESGKMMVALELILTPYGEEVPPFVHCDWKKTLLNMNPDEPQ